MEGADCFQGHGPLYEVCGKAFRLQYELVARLLSTFKVELVDVYKLIKAGIFHGLDRYIETEFFADTDQDGSERQNSIPQGETDHIAHTETVDDLVTSFN